MTVARQLRRSYAFTKRCALAAGVVLRQRTLHYTDDRPRKTARRGLEPLDGGEIRRVVAEVERRTRR